MKSMENEDERVKIQCMKEKLSGDVGGGGGGLVWEAARAPR